jgi:5-methylcytosine-specific restriction endonuclease McrA
MKRSPLSRKTPMSFARRPRIRSWHEAREKVQAAGSCRSCGYTGHLEAAHTVGRQFQDEKGVQNTYLWVNPRSVIPLCRRCHVALHDKRLDISGLLSWAELMNAARACKKHGLDLRRRLTGKREYSSSRGLSKGS